MSKIIVWNVVTVDGCFEGEKPWDLSFHELVWGEELEALSLEQLKEAEMLVFGKNTYKGMADYWTTTKDDGEVTELMNGIKKIVCSKTLEKAEWNNTTIIRDAVVELEKIKEEKKKPIYIFGSGELCRSLMNAGLIDEIRLCMAPIILGKGKRLFDESNQTRKLKLLESKQLKNGGVIVRYVVEKK